MSHGFDDVENNCVLESGFYRKFSVAEDREVEVEKPSCGRGRGGEKDGRYAAVGSDEATGAAAAISAVPAEPTLTRSGRLLR